MIGFAAFAASLYLAGSGIGTGVGRDLSGIAIGGVLNLVAFGIGGSDRGDGAGGCSGAPDRRRSPEGRR